MSDHGAGRQATGHQEGAGAAPSSWEAYYGQLLLGDGLAAIPRALYLYQGALGLSAQQVWFVACLLAQQWADAYPCQLRRPCVRAPGRAHACLKFAQR